MNELISCSYGTAGQPAVNRVTCSASGAGAGVVAAGGGADVEARAVGIRSRSRRKARIRCTSPCSPVVMAKYGKSSTGSRLAWMITAVLDRDTRSSATPMARNRSTTPRTPFGRRRHVDFQGWHILNDFGHRVGGLLDDVLERAYAHGITPVEVPTAIPRDGYVAERRPSTDLCLNDIFTAPGRSLAESLRWRCRFKATLLSPVNVRTVGDIA